MLKSIVKFFMGNKYEYFTLSRDGKRVTFSRGREPTKWEIKNAKKQLKKFNT